MGEINVERKPVNFIGSIIRPLSAKISTNTSCILSIPSDDTISFVAIPKTYLTSSTSSTVYLTLKTSVTAETVSISIATSSTILSTSLLLTIFQDTSGNVYGHSL